MTNTNNIQQLEQLLWADEGTHVYAIFDGASVPDLQDHLFEQQPDYICLYRGELAPDIAEVAPYLVRLEKETEFAHWALAEGWGQHWGIFVRSQAELHELRQHFRKFLTVYTPDNTPVLFRYYDPRVLRIYLPTCNAEELATVFGPVTSYFLEGEKPDSALRFAWQTGALQTERLALDPA